MFETDRLSELIAEKHDLLERLRELSRRQTEVAADGDMTRLLALLAAKQHVLRRVQEVERRLDPYRQQDPERRRWRSPEARAQARRLAERCRTLLREIMVMEKQSEQALARRRDAAAARLKDAQAGAQARRAYVESQGGGGGGANRAAWEG